MTYFGHHFGHERLSSEPRLYSHNEDVVELIYERKYRVHWRFGFYRHSNSHS